MPLCIFAKVWLYFLLSASLRNPHKLITFGTVNYYSSSENSVTREFKAESFFILVEHFSSLDVGKLVENKYMKFGNCGRAC